ncbi:signal peptidase I Serine peptidase. MEROPS family S26A [Tistlia consotensis]|uniref:Signal peptidase I n=1 Tax=Tistlia consotensis USBA 355 TaxID=560819 RepID=A0A1Y6BSA8_9PROT|nr:signal peptidase I [Tistlia consotensis]SMF18227.1 signal peptidase I Serine peptidase. MEROPS family S26A [Tistlia consotensis USBA 355]SNR39814.1 signal peptidase I Serine peptidase. MEROPS family S26A [Tistlia consotensis]
MTEEKQGGTFGETVRTVVYAVLIAIVLRTFAYEPFSIPSGSMLPTLKIGDYLFVSKFSYGYSHFSLPWGWPPFKGRVLGSDQPVQRGDVAVFILPSDGKTDYIKRIIGLPGDTIQVKEGRLYINGKIVDRQLVKQDIHSDAGGFPQTVTEYQETLPNGVKHMIWERDDRSMLDNTPVFTVPPDHYFAMGDNRDNSADSRTPQVGYVPKENLIGRAEFLFFSVDGSAHFWEIWKWPTAIRWDRLFHGIG